MTRPLRSALLFVVLALVFASCASGTEDATSVDPSPTSEEAASTETAPATAPTVASEKPVPTQEPVPTPEPVPSGPLVLAVPSGEATIFLDTPSTGGGKHPLLTWSELADASYYGVYMYAPSGDPYWFWRGEESSVFVGGSVQLNDNAMGVAVTAEMTWGVVGYADDDSVVGVSELVSLAP